MLRPPVTAKLRFPGLGRARNLRVLAAAASIPQQLVLAAGLAYLGVFALLLFFGRPGLGIGQGFYLPIVLVALATSAGWGIAAGFGALLLYEAGLLIPGHASWSALIAVPTAIRLTSYLAAGAAVGYLARQGRGMLASSLHLLDDLLALAKRDHLTGTFTSRGFESAINRRLTAAAPFALLVGELSEQEGNALRHLHLGDGERVRELTRLVAGRLDTGDEFAHLGVTGFAVLTSASTLAQARDASVALETHAHAAGHELSFGWAFRPADGNDVLALHRAALRRLHARQFVRGDWKPTPTTSGLVDPLPAAHRLPG